LLTLWIFAWTMFQSTFASWTVINKKVVLQNNSINSSYKTYYSIVKGFKENVNKYYVALLLWKKEDTNKYYSEAKEKFEKVNSIAKKLNYFRRGNNINFDNFLDNVLNIKFVLEKLWIKPINYYSYNDRKQSSIFEKIHTISLKTILKNKNIDWIYLWTIVRKQKQYFYLTKNSYIWKKYKTLKKIYTKNSDKSGVIFKKLDRKNTITLKINLFDYIKQIDPEESIVIISNIYIKKWNNYISILNYPIYDYFNLSKSYIQYSFEKKYNLEYWITNSYWKQSLPEVIKNNILKKIDKLFSNLKSKMTTDKYLTLLKKIKSNLIKFKNDTTKYDNLYEWINSIDTYNQKYNQFKKIKNKEEIVNLLLEYISTEILSSNLKWIIIDFMK